MTLGVVLLIYVLAAVVAALLLFFVVRAAILSAFRSERRRVALEAEDAVIAKQRAEGAAKFDRLNDK